MSPITPFQDQTGGTDLHPALRAPLDDLLVVLAAQIAFRGVDVDVCEGVVGA